MGSSDDRSRDMDMTQAFTDFLAATRLTQAQRDAAIAGHRTLRARLQGDPGLQPRIVSIFLQGSYRRATALRPSERERLDVDVVVVTDLPRETTTPDQALRLFRPFLQHHYPGKWATQGRSLGIELSSVDLDLVITSAPSRADLLRVEEQATAIDEDIHPSPAEVEAWRTEPLYIPNRETSRWEPTHPLAQIAWTRAKNAKCNGHYVGVVRAIKWWRRAHPSLPKHPKSYPLEHLVGDCCPDGIRSVAEGIARTFEVMVSRYEPAVMVGRRPVLANHGVPQQDVLARVPTDDFVVFIRAATQAAKRAEEALKERDPDESVRRWRDLLGSKFSS